MKITDMFDQPQKQLIPTIVDVEAVDFVPLNHPTKDGHTYQVLLHTRGETYAGFAYPGTYRLKDKAGKPRRVGIGSKVKLATFRSGDYLNFIYSQSQWLA